ncbi:DUF362 domain-containing protein [candidate division KSB1 bacterium]|nr:DUF362 domain-containing protein [candidate division KSB1 bacterium]
MKRKQESRRDFIKKTAGFGFAVAGFSLLAPTRLLSAVSKTPASPDIAIARGGDPLNNTLKAVEAMGGISTFVKPGDRVVLKPNSLTANPPETATTTHPSVVEAMIRLCRDAGAKKITVLSHDALRNFQRNGIGVVADKMGAEVVAAVSASDYQEVPVLRGRILRLVQIATPLLEADVFINLPIAKHHSGTTLSLGMKNHMGVIWDRSFFHQHGLAQCIADLSTVAVPQLVVMDANRILLSNGPTGPGQTRDEKMVIAGTDQVAVDAYTTTVFGKTPEQIHHIAYAASMGVGSMDLATMRINEISG